ncbi:hypothetical protein BC828DRAFT_384296 [Blastocladiella britannica]|nr:hypothetical protein BC828DRAFT_384296 [Blastocladiella britannica]
MREAALTLLALALALRGAKQKQKQKKKPAKKNLWNGQMSVFSCPILRFDPSFRPFRRYIGGNSEVCQDQVDVNVTGLFSMNSIVF